MVSSSGTLASTTATVSLVGEPSATVSNWSSSSTGDHTCGFSSPSSRRRASSSAHSASAASCGRQHHRWRSGSSAYDSGVHPGRGAPNVSTGGRSTLISWLDRSESNHARSATISSSPTARSSGSPTSHRRPSGSSSATSSPRCMRLSLKLPLCTVRPTDGRSTSGAPFWWRATTVTPSRRLRDRTRRRIGSTATTVASATSRVPAATAMSRATRGSTSASSWAAHRRSFSRISTCRSRQARDVRPKRTRSEACSATRRRQTACAAASISRYARRSRDTGRDARTAHARSTTCALYASSSSTSRR